jgi:hypothetical protein
VKLNLGDKLSFILVLFCSGLIGQTFDLEQVEQVYRPRLKLDSRYIFNSSFSDTTGNFSDLNSNAVFTFPIRSKMDADLNFDPGNFSLKNFLKNPLKIKLSQTLGSIRVGYRQTELSFDTLLPKKNFYNVSASLMGMKLDRKFRIVFYNVGVNVLEQDKTFDQFRPRINALIGRVHVKGLVKKYYYGLGLVYSDGLFIPLPFFGGSLPYGDKFVLNFTLPATVNFQFKLNKTNLYLGASADGFRSGMEMDGMRTNLNHTGGQAFLMVRHKMNNSLMLRFEGGYYFYSNLSISNTFFNSRTYNIQPGPYVNLGVNILFGQTLFEKVSNKVLDKVINLN